MIRLVPDQSGEIARKPTVTFAYNTLPVSGYDGETLATALLRAGLVHLRNAPEDNAPRGVFCAMGLCQECVVQINGAKIESCRATVSEGLNVFSNTFAAQHEQQ